MASYSFTCAECGKPFKAMQPRAAYCGAPCRRKFNNRRRDRGAVLYDALMATRFDPKDKRPDNGVVNALLDAYRTADTAARAARPSWQPWHFAQMVLPIAYGRDGDKR